MVGSWNISAGHFVIENRFVRWLGNLTYGIYLWHYAGAEFIVGASGMAGICAPQRSGPSWRWAYVDTYQLIERPILGERRPQATPPRRTLPREMEGA
ncbi:MAG: hypothetical protein IPK17_19435 [Chloroflexi bacterium]|uniref:hypothetical protein n=1 Tax=Candidatus Flexifilum breve TaxID=3140694 RepID=UPI00313738AD|nr:hypothetical protein [Chloroflexota bacterium]